jgi:hypothetical protein
MSNRLACSRCGEEVAESYQAGRCYVDDCEPAEMDEHAEAEPWESVHGTDIRELTRKTCFSLARVLLIVAGTVLAEEYLFPSKDRSWTVIGPAIGLACASVIGMFLTRKRKK